MALSLLVVSFWYRTEFMRSVPAYKRPSVVRTCGWALLRGGLTLSKVFGDVVSGRVLLPLDLVIADLGNDAEDLPHTQPVEVIEAESALESLVYPQGCGQWSVCGAASFFGSAVGVSSPV